MTRAAALAAILSLVPAAPKVEPPKLDLTPAIEGLRSSDATKIEAALSLVRIAGKEGGGRRLVGEIGDRLKMGMPVPLVRKALETLTELEDAAAEEACVLYATHREAEVRVEAVRCLASTHAPSSHKPLRRALDDQDPRVRAAAAIGVGLAKDAEALPDLVLALDRGVGAAATSIGMICEARGCLVLLDHVKTKPLESLSDGLEQILGRKDVPDEVKLHVIHALRALETQKARALLAEVRGSWPATGSKTVSDALDRAIAELEGAVK
jgi:HEAT repeat protein